MTLHVKLTLRRRQIFVFAFAPERKSQWEGLISAPISLVMIENEEDDEACDPDVVHSGLDRPREGETDHLYIYIRLPRWGIVSIMYMFYAMTCFTLHLKYI